LIHHVHRALLCVHNQLQPLLKKLRDRGHHPFTCNLTAHVYVAVIGITAEAVASLFQFLVELIEQDVGQQRRQWAALRRPFVR
jgi:hypothetical protein